MFEETKTPKFTSVQKYDAQLYQSSLDDTIGWFYIVLHLVRDYFTHIGMFSLTEKGFNIKAYVKHHYLHSTSLSDRTANAAMMM